MRNSRNKQNRRKRKGDKWPIRKKKKHWKQNKVYKRRNKKFKSSHTTDILNSWMRAQVIYLLNVLKMKMYKKNRDSKQPQTKKQKRCRCTAATATHTLSYVSHLLNMFILLNVCCCFCCFCYCGWFSSSKETGAYIPSRFRLIMQNMHVWITFKLSAKLELHINFLYYSLILFFSLPFILLDLILATLLLDNPPPLLTSLNDGEL